MTSYSGNSGYHRRQQMMGGLDFRVGTFVFITNKWSTQQIEIGAIAAIYPSTQQTDSITDGIIAATFSLEL